MGKGKLPAEERLAGGDGKNLAVGAFDDERCAVPFLLHVFLFGREFFDPGFAEGAAPASQRTRLA